MVRCNAWLALKDCPLPDREPPELPPPPYQPRRSAAARGLLFGLSVPERALRGAAGVVGGTLRESAQLLLPDAVRNAKTYRTFIGQMLDFMAEDIGGVPAGATGARSDDRVNQFMARKSVGNFVEVASLATLHLSPMLLLAIVSDMAYGSQAYLRELAEELQRQGVLEDAAAVRQVDDLLDAVAAASAQTATAFDTPPLSAEGLRETVRETRAALTAVDLQQLLPERDLASLWDAMQGAARRAGVSAFSVSGLMTLGSLDKIGRAGTGALATVQAAGTLLDRNVLSHYRSVLQDIEARGFYASLAAASRPYLDAAAQHFSWQHSTATEAWLERGARRAWRKARGWVEGRHR